MAETIKSMQIVHVNPKLHLRNIYKYFVGNILSNVFDSYAIRTRLPLAEQRYTSRHRCTVIYCQHIRNLLNGPAA